jgi:hypothetical protein
VPLLQARRDGLHNFGFGLENNSTTHDVEVTHVVFVSLFNTDTQLPRGGPHPALLRRGGPRPALLPRGGPRPALAQLNQSQSQAADVPECNSGGVAVVRAPGGAMMSSSPSSPMSPGEISTSSLSGRSGLAGFERTRGSVR